MRCSGSPKCNCTLFQGGRRAKRCKTCRHDQKSHYEPNEDDNSSGDDSSSSNDIDNADNNNNNTKRPSTSTTNKMTVSSLVADLINSGEHLRTNVENATREAKAGLTKRQVSSMLTRSSPRNPSSLCHSVWIKAEGGPRASSKARGRNYLTSNYIIGKGVKNCRVSPWKSGQPVSAVG